MPRSSATGWADSALLIFFLICIPITLSASPDTMERDYTALKSMYKEKKSSEFENEASAFLKKYPSGKYVPEIRLLIAEKESDPELAVEKFRSIIKNYRNFPSRDYALFRICQILELKSSWKELKSESENGIRLFPKSRYLDSFRLALVRSCIMINEYDTARNEALKITETTHDPEILACSLLCLAESEKKTSGNSRAYLRSLNDFLTGFTRSGLYVSGLLKLAVYYGDKNDYNRSYSACLEIISIAPESPEADTARIKISKLKKFKPVKTAFMPDRKMLNTADEIDISPEIEIKKSSDRIYYSVSIGPFTKSKDADRMSGMLKNYDECRKIRVSYGYILYMGEYPDADSALEVRIRLAEEYGINGKIVRCSDEPNRKFIYGD